MRLDERASGLGAVRELRRRAILDFLIWLERKRGIVPCNPGQGSGGRQAFQRAWVSERTVQEFLDSSEAV
jgi:hypothetical protein